MPATTVTNHVARRKTHTCSLCATPVSLGQTYSRWRYFNAHGAGTVIVHPDCYVLWQDLEDYAEWADGDLRHSLDLLGNEAFLEKASKAEDVTVAAVWLTWLNHRRPEVPS